MAESENPPLPAHAFSLYAGDLHPDVTEHDLYNLFSRISPSHTVHLCRNQITHISLCYAYINFFIPSHAAAALCRLNHTVLKGKPIRIMWVQTDAFLRRTGIGILFVKNLAVDIDVGKLKDVFGVFGRIISCKIAIKDDGKSKGFGYVQFHSEESAAEALSALDGSVLDGKILTVVKYLNKSERKEAQFTNVYVKNLDVDFTRSSLLEKFSEYGKVTSAVIVNDAEGKSRGFGFVNFESHENAKKAIEALNDAEIGSKKWFVGKAIQKSERDAILKRAPKLKKPLERQVELEDRVPSLLKPLGNQVELEDRVLSLLKPLKNQDPYMQVSIEQESSKAKEDRISLMPNDILTLILSSIGKTEDILRTRACSKNWRNLWLSVPFIDVDWNRRPGITCSDLRDESVKDDFEEFVNWVIRNGDKALSLHSVHLNCFNFVRFSTLGEWIHAVINRNAKVIKLSFCSRDNQEKICLPKCLLLCDQLTLCLYGFGLGKFSSCRDHHYQNHRSRLLFLQLERVELTKTVLDELLDTCTLLEDLRIVDCFVRNYMETDLTVSCPRLKYLVVDNHVESGDEPRKGRLCWKLLLNCPQLLVFEYRGHAACTIELVSTRTLKTITICPQECFRGFVGVAGDSVDELFRQVLRVECLEINHCFLQCIGPYYEPVLLPRLMFLKLKTKIDMRALNMLIKILEGCGNLKSLHLTIEEVCLTKEDLCFQVKRLEKLKDGERIKILTSSLKSVVLLALERDGDKKLEVGRVLLAHASALQSMVFSWEDKKKYQEEKRATRWKVSRYKKVAPGVKLHYTCVNND